MSEREPDESTRGGRFLSIRRRLGLTGEAFAGVLNDAAEQLGFDPYWTGPKITNTEKGKRDLSIEDVAIVARVDPKKRGWFWVAFGRAEPPRASGARVLGQEAPQAPYMPGRRGQGRG
jgi:hypothetical protein